MPLHEEQMRVGKRQVEAGGVRLRKIVRTETVRQPVELSHEDIVVERVEGRAGEASVSGQAFEGEELFIPLRREEPVVEKQASLREQVRVRKDTKQEQQSITGEVRKEDIEIEKRTGNERPGRNR